MIKRFWNLFAALTLTLALLCPVSAAGTPTLWMEEGGAGNVRLTLQNVGSRDVNSVQLELTLNGSYPRTGFTMAGSAYDQFGYCKVEESGNRTVLTIYVDSVRPLNSRGTISVGTLSLGSGWTAPSTARLTVLDSGLEPSGSGNGTTIPVRSSGDAGTIPGQDREDGSYIIRTDSVGRGAIMVSPGSAERGDTITVAVRPDSGYELSELTATGDGRRLQLNDMGNGRFTFVMPGADVEVRGAFTALPVQMDFPFTDVPRNAWFRGAAEYVYENALMSGTSATSFGPDQPTSRGMIVTILYRLAGSPAAGASGFADVASGQYYAKAVAWASANGVVNGYGNGRFGPNDPITREQLAVILRGYARLRGQDVSAQANLSGYRDAGKISPYALEPLRWASARGLINGTSDTTLTPNGTATRAQVAVILKNFCENVLHQA